MYCLQRNANCFMKIESRQGLASLLNQLNMWKSEQSSYFTSIFLLCITYLCLHEYFIEESYSFLFLLPIYAKTNISGILNVTKNRMTKIKVKTIGLLGHLLL